MLRSQRTRATPPPAPRDAEPTAALSSTVVAALQEELRQCQDELQLAKAEREDFSHRWEQQRTEQQQRIQALTTELRRQEAALDALRASEAQLREQAAAQATELARLQTAAVTSSEREALLVQTKTELQTHNVILGATVNDLIRRLEEVVTQREANAEQRRAVERRAAAVTRYARQQSALVTALAPHPGAIQKPQQAYVNMASHYF